MESIQGEVVKKKRVYTDEQKARKKVYQRAWLEANREKRAAKKAAWKAANPKRVAATKAAYAAVHREKAAAYTAAWRKANPGRSAAASKLWYAANREKAHAAHSAWRADNPGINRAIKAKRRAAKLQRTPSWADRDAIAAIYTDAARLTKETGIPHDVDHIIPLQGKLVSGLHVAGNLRAIPASLNRSKHNRFDVSVDNTSEQW